MLNEMNTTWNEKTKYNKQNKIKWNISMKNYRGEKYVNEIWKK